MQTKKAELIKQSIANNCSKCFGLVCRECAPEIERINIYMAANIPLKYWNYTFDTFNGDMLFKKRIMELTQDITKLYMEGNSFFLTGPHGIGKTFAACEILKTSLKNGLKAIYSTMTEIIDMAINGKSNYKHELINADIICIDELDSRYIPTSERGQEVFGSNMENIIRTRFQNELPIIFCTNNSSYMDIFGGPFENAFSSLFASKKIIHIPVGGKDLRIHE